MLEIEEKILDYTFKEKTQVQPGHRFNGLINLTYFIILILLVFFITIFKSEYTDKILTALVSFIGGGSLGYSVGRKVKISQ